MAERGKRRIVYIRRLGLRIALVLLATFTLIHQLTADLRFHPDEAFFMTFARGAAVNGDWLLPGTLDKPPLAIYFSALSMVAVGNTADDAGVLQLDIHLGEFAGLLPNAMLGILLVALMMRLAWITCRHENAALLAGALTAVSPYTLVYGASAFTDMNLLFWSLVALYLGLVRRWSLAGVALGLAFWSKQQAIYTAVFILVLWLLRGARRADGIRLLLPVFVMAAVMLIWDGARPETSVFLQGVVNNTPPNWLAEPTTWPGRLMEWARAGGWLLGPPLVTVLLLAFTVLGHLFGRPMAKSTTPVCRLNKLFAYAVLAFGVIHCVFNFNLYERYLLLIAPLLIILVAGRMVTLLDRRSRGNLLAAVCAALVLGGAVYTLGVGTPIEGKRADYAGIDRLAAHLNSKPVATVIYDPWLGWELGYYLGVWSDKRRVHYPTAEALVAGALALDEIGARYLVAPVDVAHNAWLSALKEAGFRITEDYRRDRFVVFQLLAPSD